MVRQSAGAQSRQRARKALLEGKDFQARGEVNKAIFEEVRAELQQEVAKGKQELKNTSRKGVKRMELARDKCIQQIQEAGAEEIDSVEVVIGRLRSVAGIPVAQLIDQRASGEDEGHRRWVLTREQRLTTMKELPEGNTIVDGALWSVSDRAEISATKSARVAPDDADDRSPLPDISSPKGRVLLIVAAGVNYIAANGQLAGRLVELGAALTFNNRR